MTRTVNPFGVPYPDFKLGEIIDPEQFDANNAEIIRKLNEVISVLNEDKTNLVGDHKGTWQGMTPGDASSESINGARIDALANRVTKNEGDITTANTNHTNAVTRLSLVETITRNAQKEIANLNLYMEANNRVINGHSYGTNFSNTFGMTIHDANTTLSSALSNGSGLVNVVNSAGFAVGDTIYIFNNTVYDRVVIQSINGNSISISPAVTRPYTIKSGFAKSMLDAQGHFRGFSILQESFETTPLTGWSTGGNVISATDWFTDGSKSHKLIGTFSDTGEVSALATLSKAFDLTNVSYITFDFRFLNSYTQTQTESIGANYNALFSVFIGSEQYTPACTNNVPTSFKIDVRNLTGTHIFKFQARGTMNYNDRQEPTTVNVDNLCFEFQNHISEFTIDLPNTTDVVTWLDAVPNITFTGKLGTVDMAKTVEGNQTQLYAKQPLGVAKIHVVATASGNIVRKINKILGGHA